MNVNASLTMTLCTWNMCVLLLASFTSIHYINIKNNSLITIDALRIVGSMCCHNEIHTCEQSEGEVHS